MNTGSYSKTAGHDINYIALSGALSVRTATVTLRDAATSSTHCVLFLL